MQPHWTNTGAYGASSAAAPEKARLAQTLLRRKILPRLRDDHRLAHRTALISSLFGPAPPGLVSPFGGTSSNLSRGRARWWRRAACHARWSTSAFQSFGRQYERDMRRTLEDQPPSSRTRPSSPTGYPCHPMGPQSAHLHRLHHPPAPHSVVVGSLGRVGDPDLDR